MKYFKKLVGDRIYLSPRSTEDSEKFTEWMNDFETTDYIGRSNELMTLEMERKFLEEHTNEPASFVIVTLQEDKMIGTISLEQINSIHRVATLGIFIGDKEYRDNGYGTEAIKLILEYGFRYLNLKNIDLRVLDCNERAKKCYQKCGFQECGKRKQAYFLNGTYYDYAYMEILANEFEGDFIRNKNL